MDIEAITPHPQTAHDALYETDFYAWTQQQAGLLRDRQWRHLDLPNLIEEIELGAAAPRCTEGQRREG